ncbi:rhamnulokinase [Solibacillus silvestris]|uniref:rhamnulokinase n=1 Tax=Solibacillus silvestris TaxID=76853 RepID=UPI003F7D6828
MHHLAIDIGASSGRIVHGKINGNQLVLQEIHRFPNQFKQKNGHSFWDIDYLFNEILIGLQIAKKQGISSCTLGIDTWAVDYVLLDEYEKRLQEVYSYRDERTNYTMEKVFKKINRETIYKKTGIQFLSFNTLFQLFEENSSVLQQAKTIFLVPDYLNFLLTGIQTFEITNASTTQLLNIHSRQLDPDLLQLLGLSAWQFPKLIEPGEKIGRIQKTLQLQYDLPEATVISVASHDTASAVLGTPASTENWAYLSSGTWSLVGIERGEPIITAQTLNENYTNEYGAFSTYRFLKNIMGLWVIQEVQRLLPEKYSFAQLVELAKEVQDPQAYINLNESRFLNPENMIEEIQHYCQETNQVAPQTPGELAACIFQNLAVLIAFHLEHIEQTSNAIIDHLHIVGGGSNNDYLNGLIAKYSQKTIYAGPSEATAIGNILIQLISNQSICNIREGRAVIHNSFPIKQFSPAVFNKAQLFETFFEKTLLKSEEST